MSLALWTDKPFFLTSCSVLRTERTLSLRFTADHSSPSNSRFRSPVIAASVRIDPSNLLRRDRLRTDASNNFRRGVSRCRLRDGFRSDCGHPGKATDASIFLCHFVVTHSLKSKRTTDTLASLWIRFALLTLRATHLETYPMDNSTLSFYPRGVSDDDSAM